MTDDPARREEALEQAAALFLRFGYRKTSMDEVARAVGLSRQGLYLWFPNKQALFTAMLEHVFAKTARGLEAILGDESRPVPDRILDAYSLYVRGYVGTGTTASALDELLETSVRIVGDRVAQADDAFVARVAELLEPYGDERVSAMDRSRVLAATSKGLKLKVEDLDAYRELMAKAIALAVRAP